MNKVEELLKVYDEALKADQLDCPDLLAAAQRALTALREEHTEALDMLQAYSEALHHMIEVMEARDLYTKLQTRKKRS